MRPKVTWLDVDTNVSGVSADEQCQLPACPPKDEALPVAPCGSAPSMRLPNAWPQDSRVRSKESRGRSESRQSRQSPCSPVAWAAPEVHTSPQPASPAHSPAQTPVSPVEPEARSAASSPEPSGKVPSQAGSRPASGKVGNNKRAEEEPRIDNSDEESLPDCSVRRPSIASFASVQSSVAQKLELLEVWTRKPTKKSRKRAEMQRKLARGTSFESLGSMESMELMFDSHPKACCCIPVLDPNSTRRACWDVASIVLVIYDMVMIPLQLFDLPESASIDVVSWTTRLFWTFDIFLSFITGILQPNGSIEMRPIRIAKNYLLTWFLVDMLIVCIDWVEVLWTSGSFLGFARAGKAGRTFRIIRLVRLIRLARVRNIFTLMLERLKSEQLVIIAGIINIMLVIVSLGHVIACLWYGIAIGETAGSNTWLIVHGFDTAPIEMKYFTALHWSLLQFAGGTDEIVPQNVGERIYAVLVFLVAFVMAAVFVGRLTSSMTQLHMLSRKNVEKFQVLKRYLHKNEISAILSMRVIHNAQHALAETQRFMEESRVELLSIISDPLRVELHFELYSPVLAVHPFFRCFIDACPQVMKKICHKAMSQLLVSTGDIIFMPGEIPSPPRMFIICSGELSYHFVSGAVAYVQVGQWISEATLWTSWTHQGMLKAASDCRLCLLDATAFLQLAETVDHDFDVRKYARTFLESMNKGNIDVSDLPYNEDAEEIMEVISALSSKEWSAPVHPEPVARLRRVTTNQSLASATSTTMSTDDPLSRKSVLMVTPAGRGNSGEFGKTQNRWWQ